MSLQKSSPKIDVRIRHTLKKVDKRILDFKIPTGHQSNTISAVYQKVVKSLVAYGALIRII